MHIQRIFNLGTTTTPPSLHLFPTMSPYLSPPPPPLPTSSLFLSLESMCPWSKARFLRSFSRFSSLFFNLHLQSDERSKQTDIFYKPICRNESFAGRVIFGEWTIEFNQCNVFKHHFSVLVESCFPDLGKACLFWLQRRTHELP